MQEVIKMQEISRSPFPGKPSDGNPSEGIFCILKNMEDNK